MIIDSERGGKSKCIISLTGKELEVMDKFWYLRMKFGKDGSGKYEVESTVL